MSGAAAQPLDRERLARLLGMLGSDFDNEVLSASRLAERLRCVNPPIPRQQRDRIEQRFLDPALLAEAIEFVQDNLYLLSQWERGFVSSIAARRGPLTPKQLAVLTRLVRRVAEGAF